jgi:SAM-dependent methyltransferase
MNKTSLRNILREAYDKYAQERDSHALQDWKSELRAMYLSLLQAQQKKTMLEVGAGPGRDSKYFQDNGLDVVCIDLSPAMVELCRQKGLDAHVMDMADLQFPADSFDAMYSMNSLLHLTKAEFPAVLQSLAKVLKPDGVGFIGMYGGIDHEGIRENDNYEPKRFFSFYTNEHLQQVVREVFEVLSFESFTAHPDDDLKLQWLLLRKKRLD